MTLEGKKLQLPAPKNTEGSQHEHPADGSFVLKIQEFIRKIWQNFDAKTSSAPTTVYLPETVSYASRYRDAQFGKNEVEAMLQPQFKGTGVYLALKFLDKFPVQQKEVLEDLLKALAKGDDYTKIDLMILDHLQKLSGPNAQGSSIDGKKVAQIYRQGFDLFEKKFEDLARELGGGDDIPVLLAYAATLGLKPFLESLTPGKSLVILNPKKADHIDGFGYFITKTHDSFELKILRNDEDFAAATTGKKVVLVDDTKRSGETLQKVQDLFVKHPLWPKVSGERFLASPGNPNSEKV